MKKFTIVSLIVTLALTLFTTTAADAGIFGRGRGIFRGRWGSRNIGSCGASATCGPVGCASTSSPKKDVAAPTSTITMPVSP